ncbi:MAG: hypothetical protein RL038_685 [Actinomycetota bacterium]
MKRSLVVALALLTLATGCSTTPSLDPADYPELQGLNQDIAREVLGLKSVEEFWAGEEQIKARKLQLAVHNFEICRAAYNVYDIWLNTGEITEMAKISLPDNPIENVAEIMSEDINDYEEAIATGEITALRDLLAWPGTCGVMVPVTPGFDLYENTIADAVNRS